MHSRDFGSACLGTERGLIVVDSRFKRLNHEAFLIRILRSLGGEVTERLKVHAWKACVGRPAAGSNPALSASDHSLQISALRPLCSPRSDLRHACVAHRSRALTFIAIDRC